ncbi:Gfo/Idh/MocA family protein [Aurantimicrobium minutum]|uniref:Gfo/Idh/MocA family protein n=1 Tax=Aurantimicrobium minutum TaxID=708131 RepID=UPI0024732358|nr:Gfo/Idh/MocA family oxidoreductase [Aurantimicrobium minutum]MDH6536191.1 putative dehydrogenase [Aurantimicrobium minutum]
MTALPQPNIIDPASVPSLRWGILGAGGIARTWAGTVLANTSQQVIAVASRTPGKAEEFARDLGIERAYNSYDELVGQADIDAIYIASYPSDHKEHALLAIAAGKHVLIEKPTTMNSRDAAAIFEASTAAGVFAMEAMWTRYLPQFDIARQLLADGALGELDLLVATFCQDNRHLERMWTKGGGSPVFDMGIYPIAFAQMFLGNPTNITAFGVVREDLIEEEAHVLMSYDDTPARTNFIVSGRTALPHTGAVSGSKGALNFGTPFVVPSSITLLNTEFNDTGVTWTDNTGIVGHQGLCYQVNYFAQYVAEGLLESPLHTHDDVVTNIAVAEEIIDIIGANPH